MNKGESITYSYTGGIQSFTVTDTGYYKLECWGAEGGKGGWYWGQQSTDGGKGGYACGYKKLSKGTVVYICVGGQGSNMYANNGGEDVWSSTSGGYNGGGNGYIAQTGSYDPETQQQTYRGIVAGAGSGGGATHMGTQNALLKNTSTSNVYIVAGGGGGGFNASAGWDSTPHPSAGGNGGNTASGSYGQGGSYGSAPSHYDNQFSQIKIGGGGGGGYNGGSATARTGGGGGSNSVANVGSMTMAGTTYNTVSQAGQRSGNGQAKITLMKKMSCYFGSNEVDSMYFGSTEIGGLYFGSNES